MEGHRTDCEDDNEWDIERTGKTNMKGHRTDWEDGYEGTQNGLRRRQ